MLFNSFEFVFFFLPVVLCVYWVLARYMRGELLCSWIVASSLFFYGWWNVSYVPMIVLSALFNYVVGKIIITCADKNLQKKACAFVFLGVAGNLFALSYFKYFNFFLSNIYTVVEFEFESHDILLPLGISFFTFQQIAYLVDCSKRKVERHGLVSYAAFVIFFPQLIAGPIVHHREMMPQFLREIQKIDYDNVAKGFFLFSIGLFKKVVIADTLSAWVGNGYGSALDLNFFEAWFTSLFYTLQLYFDFSGYTDMALGVGRMFNIVLPENFNSPYKALSIQDFWARWHVTLSRFLRDYVYIPLGGNRWGVPKTLRNLFVTFLIGGLWHGAGWTFLVWGALHGLALCLHRVWKLPGRRLSPWLSWFVTFNFVNLCWVFFRASSFSEALNVLRAMAGLNGIVFPQTAAFVFPALKGTGLEFGAWLRHVAPGEGIVPLAVLVGSLVVALLFRNSNQMVDGFKPGRANFAVAWALAVTGILYINNASEFLYFQF